MNNYLKKMTSNIFVVTQKSYKRFLINFFFMKQKFRKHLFEKNS